MNYDSLCGQKLTHVDAGDDSIMLTLEDGRRVHIYHQQDCCENVRIVDTEGEWHTLIGKVLVEASEIQEDEPPEGFDPYDSWTHTVLTFRTDEDTVICRWLGESNGYYSEDISIQDISGPSKQSI